MKFKTYIYIREKERIMKRNRTNENIPSQIIRK